MIGWHFECLGMGWMHFARGRDVNYCDQRASYKDSCNNPSMLYACPFVIWLCCSSHQWADGIYLLLEYSMYIVPCNLLCHRKYSGSDSVWLLRSQQGLAASSLAFLEHCYLVNKPKILSLMLRYQETREIMKRWRKGPGHLSNYSNSDQTHEWGHLACPWASLQLTANAWMSPADIMWCRRTSHMSSAKLPIYITEWINNCCSNSWATYLAFSDYYSWSWNNADLNCVHLYADFFQ